MGNDLIYHIHAATQAGTVHHRSQIPSSPVNGSARIEERPHDVCVALGCSETEWRSIHVVLCVRVCVCLYESNNCTRVAVICSMMEGCEVLRISSITVRAAIQ